MIKKFEEFDEERQELYTEYEEFYGFPVGNTFIFAPYQSDSGFQIVINPKSYWDNEKCCYDQSVDGLVDMPSGFGEASESDFEYKGTIEEAIKKLIDFGFKHDQKFQSFIERSSESYGDLKIGELSISDYIVKNYPNSVI